MLTDVAERQHAITNIANWQRLLDVARQQDVSRFKQLLGKLIAELDGLMSRQLSAVINAEEFKQLEASWLSLQRLVMLPINQRRAKVKLLDASWQDVASDLNLSFDLTKSNLYRKVYSQELDTAGGQPFGLLLVDHKVHADMQDDSDFDDLYSLQLVAELGERALCPVVMGVNHDFFGDDPARQLHDSARVSRILSSVDYQSWQLLRGNIATRFLHLVMPEVRLRQPWQHCSAGFVFNQPMRSESVLWGNPAYLMAESVLKEFDRISWFGFLRAYDERGSYGAILSPTADQFVPTRVDIFSEMDGFWSEKGFTVLTSLYLSGHQGFFSNQSVWQAPDEASRLLGMLQTNLMACRFGHYIKAQIRDQIGRYDSAQDCQRSLERWLQRYTSDVDYGDDVIMARYPLKSYEVNLVEDPRDVTRYLCEIKLQPQYQYEILDAQIILSTNVSSREVGEGA
ncbi:type VI secretion system contractile sheath domain-containing protein [Thaumasiovibrio subtropicus]|uniref:type VI secretion system contractile sheath domain-containing protein n=1 Tax=Thaumasiovibrio subtropicus TaxID=1891207 RepID=UPI000B34ED59|nr:type VI secretion system contractile sheath large subunit [Thaumasiovibrio subtropicus]